MLQGSLACLMFAFGFGCAEDEQKTNMASQKSLQQLTMEKEQALSDLNSVERSLSELFRRYENLKGVLEGFKKVRCSLERFPFPPLYISARSTASLSGLSFLVGCYWAHLPVIYNYTSCDL